MDATETRARYCGVGMRRLAAGLVAAAGTLALLLFLIWVSTVMYFSSLTWPRRDFSRSEWRELHGTGERYQLCRDLLSSKELLGKSRHNVQATLGQPDFEVGEEFLVYRVKETSLMGLTVAHLLIVEFDSENLVSDAFLDSD